MAEFIGRGRVGLGAITTRRPPPVHTQVRVSDGELRLSRVRYGTARPYLIVPVRRVTAKRGDSRVSVRLRIDETELGVQFPNWRTRRRFFSALGR